MGVRRTIIQDRTVSQDIENAVVSYRLVDEAIQSLEWTLAHKPEVGVHRSGRFWLYMQEGFKIHRVPEIVVLYSFTDDEVILHAIMFRPAA
jgi:predicted membrane-bound dolichyl-phosphate-mannose-protein mannosyltransferase